MATNQSTSSHTIDSAPEVKSTNPDPTSLLLPGRGETDILGGTDIGILAQQQISQSKTAAQPYILEHEPTFGRPLNVPTEDDVTYATALLRPSQDLVNNVINATPSTYIPNFNLMYAVIHEMDYHMTNTKKWYDTNSGWNPIVSELYFGVLGIIQTFRCMRAAGTIHREQLSLLTKFETVYDFSTLWIPGPLVPFFKSLSAASPTTGDNLANVTPSLPATPGWTRARMFTAQETLFRSIPNISGMMEYMTDIFTQRPPQNGWNTQNPFTVTSIRSMYGRAAVDVPEFRNLVITPGVQYAPTGDARIWESSWQRQEYIQLPPRPLFAAGEVPDTWARYMMLNFADESFRWFGQLVTLMTVYAKFQHHSVPLSRCGVNESAAGFIKMNHTARTTVYTPPQFVPAVPPGHLAHFPMKRRLNTIIAKASHSFPELPAFYELAAACTQFNCQPIGITAAQQRDGPVWNVTPDVREGNNLDTLQQLAATVNSRFHSDMMLKDL